MTQTKSHMANILKPVHEVKFPTKTKSDLVRALTGQDVWSQVKTALILYDMVAIQPLKDLTPTQLVTRWLPAEDESATRVAGEFLNSMRNKGRDFEGAAKLITNQLSKRSLDASRSTGGGGMEENKFGLVAIPPIGTKGTSEVSIQFGIPESKQQRRPQDETINVPIRVIRQVDEDMIAVRFILSGVNRSRVSDDAWNLLLMAGPQEIGLELEDAESGLWSGTFTIDDDTMTVRYMYRL